MSYDPALRLRQIVSGGVTTRLAYDGLDRIAEYDGSNALVRRYVFGPGIDQPIVWYEGSGTTDRRFLGSDERGSVVSVTDGSGTVLGLNRYDEYGQPQATNLGTWGYTGQARLPAIGLWYYKARAYEGELGRFMQLDLIGYAPSANLYAYVLNDPVNLIDPLGLAEQGNDIASGTIVACTDGCYGPPIVITGERLKPPDWSHSFGMGGMLGGIGSGSGSGEGGNDANDQPIVITGQRLSKSPAKPPSPPPTPMPPAPTPAAGSLSKRQDYCGSAELNVPEGYWSNACRVHDECYATLGARKAVCDIQLFSNIQLECFIRTGNQPVCSSIAFSYWFGVTVGGGPAFRRAQRQATVGRHD